MSFYSVTRTTLALALLTSAAFTACQGHEPPTGAHKQGLFAAAAPKLPARVAPPEVGRRLYASLCRSCHGADGRGRTALALDLRPTPADLTRCNFKLRSTPSGSSPTDRDLLRTLYVGLPGAAMPGFAGQVSLPGLRALVRQVKQRCDRFATERPEASLLRPAPAPRYSDDSVSRGRLVYLEQRCAACHGDTGRGDGPASATLKDAQGRAIRPRDHTRGVFRSGFGRADVLRAFSTGMDGTPMPALPATVTPRQRWDLAHYIVSLSLRRGRLQRTLEAPPSWYEPLATWGLLWR